MGERIVEVAAIAAVGTVVYQIIRAMNMRPLAELLKVFCYILGATSLLQLVIEVYTKIAESPIAKLITNINAWLEK